MSDDEKDYLMARAEAEIAAARSASTPEAARVHSLLAGHYLDRLHGNVDNPDIARPAN